MSLTIPASYGIILLQTLVICLQCAIEGLSIGRLRKEFFNQAFMEKNFPGIKGASAGYPDMGQGRFSDKLTDDQWMQFNNAQRAHQNYVEGLPAIIAAILIAGITFPRLTFLCGVAYIVGRFLYSSGYRTRGPKGRAPGVYILDVGLFTLVGAAIMSALQLAGGVAGIGKFAMSFVQ